MGIDTLADLRNQGLPIRAISAYLGVSTHQVNYWLSKYELTKKRNRIDPEVYAQIRTTYLATGDSTHKIAALLGISQSTVCAALFNLKKRQARYVRPLKLKKEQLESVADLSTHTAAKILNVSAMTIQRARKRLETSTDVTATQE